MPTGKSREEYIREMKEALGVKEATTFSAEDITFFEEWDKTYGDKPIADVQAEFDAVSKELSAKQAELKTLEEENTPAIEEKIKNDLEAHRKKADASEKEARDLVEMEFQRRKLNEGITQAMDAVSKATVRMIGFENSIRETGPSGNAYIVKCDKAVSSLDPTNPTFDDGFWKEKFGIDPDAPESEEFRTLKPMLTDYMIAVIARANAKNTEREIRDKTAKLAEKIGNYKDKMRNGGELERKAEAEIVKHLQGTPVNVKRRIGRVTLDYSFSANIPGYAEKRSESDDLSVKKLNLASYLKIRKTLGKRPADIDGQKLGDSFKKYADAEKEYAKLNIFEKLFAHILSGDFYGPAALLRKRNAYRETLKDIGFTGEEIDAKVKEADSIPASTILPEPAKEETVREPLTEEQTEEIKAADETLAKDGDRTVEHTNETVKTNEGKVH